MRRVALAVAILLGACTSEERDPSTSAASTESITNATEVADEAASDDALPRLQDVVVEQWEPETRTDELAAEIGREELTAQQAVDAFALLYPDMPGVSPSALPLGEGLSPHYTWLLIRHVRDSLTDEQRAVVDEMDRGEPIGTINVDGTIDESALAREELPEPASTDAGFTAGSSLESRAAQPSTQVYAHYLILAQRVFEEWRRHRPDFPVFAIVLELARKPIKYGGMQTGPEDGLPANTCKTTVDPGFVRSRPSDDLLRFFFAHEFFHCVQFQWNPSLDYRVAKWVFDGSADFAAADLYRGRYAPGARSFEHAWFTKQGRPLDTRWYDAWPVFETWYQEGHDPYPSIEAMVKGVTSPDPNATLALGNMNGLNFRMRLSSRSMRSNTYGDQDWQFAWPGAGSSAGPHDNLRRDGVRGVGTYSIRLNDIYIHPQVIVTMENKVGLVEITPAGSPVTTQTAGGPLHIAQGSTARLCFDKGGCRCPDGASANAALGAGRDVVFSFAVSEESAAAEVSARPWDPDKECQKPRKPRSSSNGDPHLVSFDGQPFDVMALGEFVNARDPSGDFEIQTRHLSISSVAAGTSAVAIGTGDHRITFTVAAIDFLAEPVIRVDGEVTDSTSLTLGDVEVAVTGTDAVLTWPDGSTVEVTYAGGWFVDVTPTAERAATLEGLMGSADGDFTNDLRMPDGTIVDPVHASVTDSDYSLSWRVEEGASLFDYEAGESAATFNVAMPDAPPVEIADEATAGCEQALGPDAADHEVAFCAFDVTVTGDSGYVDAYVEVVDDRVAWEDGFETADEKPRPVPSGSAAEPVPTGDAALTLTGELVGSGSDNVAGDDVVFGLSGSLQTAEGTVMVLRAASCTPDVTLFATVTERASGATGTFFLCDPDELQLAMADEDDEAVPGEVYFWLASGGEHDVVIESDAENPRVGVGRGVRGLGPDDRRCRRRRRQWTRCHPLGDRGHDRLHIATGVRRRDLRGDGARCRVRHRGLRRIGARHCRGVVVGGLLRARPEHLDPRVRGPVGRVRPHCGTDRHRALALTRCRWSRAADVAPTAPVTNSGYVPKMRTPGRSPREGGVDRVDRTRRVCHRLWRRRQFADHIVERRGCTRELARRHPHVRRRDAGHDGRSRLSARQRCRPVQRHVRPDRRHLRRERRVVRANCCERRAESSAPAARAGAGAAVRRLDRAVRRLRCG